MIFDLGILQDAFEMGHPVYATDSAGVSKVYQWDRHCRCLSYACKDAGATRAAYGPRGEQAPFFAGIKCEPMPR